MSVKKMERRFAEFQRRFQRGNMSRAAFEKAVSKLQIRDKDGKIWRIHPDQGQWMQWEGNRWASPPPSPAPASENPSTPSPQKSSVSPKTAPRPGKKAPKAPESLLDLFFLILKGMIKGLWWKIPLCAAMLFAVWVFHTFLLVYINEGFWAGGSSSWFANFLHLSPGNPIVSFLTMVVDGFLASTGKGTVTGTLFWMLWGALWMGALARMVRMGPGKYVGNLFSTPAWLSRSLKSEGPSGPSAFLVLVGFFTLGLFLAVILGAPSLMGSRMLVFVMALHGLSAIVARLDTLTVLVWRLGYSDAQGFISPKVKKKSFSLKGLLLCHVGLTLGLWGGSLLPLLGILGGLGVFFFGTLTGILLFLTLSKKKGSSPPPRTASFILALIITGLVSGIALQADDGGWRESGGTFTQWVKSEGAVKAVLQGLPPAIAAVLGTLLGGLGVGLGTGVGVGIGIPTPVDVGPVEVEPVDLDPVDEIPPDKVPIEKTPITKSVPQDDGKPGGTQKKDLTKNEDSDADKKKDLTKKEDADAAKKKEQEKKIEQEKKKAEEAKRKAAEAEKKAAEQKNKAEALAKKKKEELQRLEAEAKQKAAKRAELQKKIEAAQKEADAANKAAKWWGWAEWGAKKVQFVADQSINVLATVTGPVGGRVKDIYTVAKGTGEGLGKAIAEGKDYGKHILKGTAKGATDLIIGKVSDKAFGKIADKIGEKTPLLKHYSPFNAKDPAWGEARAGFIKNALQGKGVSDPVSKMVRHKFTQGTKKAAQGWVQGKMGKDPLMQKMFD